MSNKKTNSNSTRRCDRGSRNFVLLLYHDSTSYSFDDVIDKIVSIEANYFLCDHEPEDESKKPHTHCVLVFKNAKTVSALSKILGIEENYIQYCDDLRGAIRYLIHLDSPTKKQYDTHSIITNKRDTLDKYLALKDEGSIICDLLLKLDEVMSFRKLLYYACEKGYYSEFRRNFNILHTIITDERK